MPTVVQHATLVCVIKSFLHKGLRRFFESGSKSGIRPDHAVRLSQQLAALDTATCLEDMNLPGYGLHPLTGDHAGQWAVTVKKNWRITFEFHGEDAYIVDYKDYH